MAALGIAAACGANRPQGERYPGASATGPGAASPQAERKPKPPRRWAAFDAAQSWPASTAEPFVSEGHGGGRYRAEVRVSPEGRQAYEALRPGAQVPVGTVVAMLHHAQGSAGPIYAMHKRGDGWTFHVVEPDGTLVDTSVELCQRCHAEAVADHLFGVPAATAP